MAPPLPQGRRRGTGRRAGLALDCRVGLEGVSHAEASSAPPVPFPGLFSPGACPHLVCLQAWQAASRGKWLVSEHSSSPGLGPCTAAPRARPHSLCLLPGTPHPLGKCCPMGKSLLHLQLGLLFIGEGGAGILLTPDRCMTMSVTCPRPLPQVTFPTRCQNSSLVHDPLTHPLLWYSLLTDAYLFSPNSSPPLWSPASVFHMRFVPLGS